MGQYSKVEIDGRPVDRDYQSSRGLQRAAPDGEPGAVGYVRRVRCQPGAVGRHYHRQQATRRSAPGNESQVSRRAEGQDRRAGRSTPPKASADVAQSPRPRQADHRRGQRRRHGLAASRSRLPPTSSSPPNRRGFALPEPRVGPRGRRRRHVSVCHARSRSSAPWA